MRRIVVLNLKRLSTDTTNRDENRRNKKSYSSKKLIWRIKESPGRRNLRETRNMVDSERISLFQLLHRILEVKYWRRSSAPESQSLSSLGKL
jgi:hypothetical protein